MTKVAVVIKQPNGNKMITISKCQHGKWYFIRVSKGLRTNLTGRVGQFISKQMHGRNAMMVFPCGEIWSIPFPDEVQGVLMDEISDLTMVVKE